MAKRVRLDSGTAYSFSVNSDGTSMKFTGGSSNPFPAHFHDYIFCDGNGLFGNSSNSILSCVGDVIAYKSSDIRLKTNIVSIENPLERLNMIRGVYYTWKEDAAEHNRNKKDLGVIAQEVEKIIPEAVRTSPDGIKQVEYTKLIPLLIECVKEQQKQIDLLVEKVNG
jgi:hypothetical protein